jgi:AcrR family transcriptional regulator
MPRRSNAEAAQTRVAIIERAVETASIEGLEGVTIGRLADDLGMSKAGVIGHFGSKNDLQFATLRQAQAVFAAEVWEPAKRKPSGMPRLLALGEAWIKHLTHCPFPGGCFMTTVSVEFDAREGELHDYIRQSWNLWFDIIERQAAKAKAAGDLPPDTDPRQIAFEMNAIAMGLNQGLQLFGDRRAPARARRAMRRVLHQG